MTFARNYSRHCSPRRNSGRTRSSNRSWPGIVKRSPSPTASSSCIPTGGACNETVLQLELPGIKKLKSGKVREVFDLGDRLLLVASDRISAFDVIMPNGIPRKGEVLTQISHFWFEQIFRIVPNHLLARANDPLPENPADSPRKLARRSMIVKKAKPLAIECIVRGYLSGSGWKEYKKSQTVCGIKLPPGLKESAELPEPIFTPSTKAEAGHDENISFEEAARLSARTSPRRRAT
jgi:phosphoribosylaminoimidazole-succinocarboxamide synthase